MPASVLLAVAVACVTGATALVIPRHVRPATATRLITTLGLLSALGLLWALALYVGANVVQLHGIAERLSWCEHAVAAHRDSLTPAGGVAISALLAVGVSALRTRMKQRSLRAPRGERGVTVVSSDEAVAFALPGRPGRVVVSTGMLRTLDAQERRVLIAHEHAHLRRHHHRYVRSTQLAAAVFPWLVPLNAKVRYTTERWADEDAARIVGDRTLVARAIARAALATTPPSGMVLGMADTGVADRVRSLLEDPPPASRLIEVGLVSVAVLAILVLAASAVAVEPWVVAMLGLC